MAFPASKANRRIPEDLAVGRSSKARTWIRMYLTGITSKMADYSAVSTVTDLGFTALSQGDPVLMRLRRELLQEKDARPMWLRGRLDSCPRKVLVRSRKQI